MNLTAQEYSKYYPILSISNDNIIISKTGGELTVGFEIKLPAIFSRSESDYEDICATFTSALQLLPDFTIVHKQDWFINTEYHSELSSDAGFLAQSYHNHFQGRKYLKHRCYIFITKVEKSRANAYSLTSILTRSSIIINQVSREKIYQFLTAVDNFEGLVNNSRSLKLKRLTREDYLDNEKRGSGLLTQYRNLSLSPSTEYQTVELTPAMYKVGDKKLISYTISDSENMPMQYNSVMRVEEYSTPASKVLLSFGSALGFRLPIEHITNHYILLVNQTALKASLEQKSRYLKSMAKTSRANDVHSDAINECLTNVVSSGIALAKVHINVQTWSQTAEQELSNKNSILTAIESMGIKSVYNTFDTPILYWGGIPGNAADIGAESYMTVSLSAAIGLMSLEGSAKEMPCKSTTFSERISGIPLNIDLAEHAHFQEGLIENYNKFILGPSGSGKSFTTNHYLRQSYDLGGHVFIIDIGNSYKSLCGIINEQTGGEDGLYYSYNLNDPMSFNPFYSASNSYTPEKKTFLRSLICTLWKGADNIITQAELTIVSETISLFLERIKASDRILNFSDYYDFIKDEYVKMHTVHASHSSKENLIREKDFDFETFLICLQPFYKTGEHSHLLNSEKSLDLTSKRFIVFEIDNIKGDAVIFPILTMLMIDIFVTKMYCVTAKKTMLIEEAWKAIANKQMSEYILWLWKTARKHCAEAIVVTQELDDIISSPVVKDAIVNNSAIKILQDMQAFKNFNKAAELLSLSQEDKAQILSLNRKNNPLRRYKEAWISIGTWNSVYAIEVSPEEGCAYNTDKHKKVELEDLATQTGSIINAIKQLVKQK